MGKSGCYVESFVFLNKQAVNIKGVLFHCAAINGGDYVGWRELALAEYGLCIPSERLMLLGFTKSLKSFSLCLFSTFFLNKKSGAKKSRLNLIAYAFGLTSPQDLPGQRTTVSHYTFQPFIIYPSFSYDYCLHFLVVSIVIFLMADSSKLLKALYSVLLSSQHGVN